MTEPELGGSLWTTRRRGIEQSRLPWWISHEMSDQSSVVVHATTTTAVKTYKTYERHSPVLKKCDDDGWRRRESESIALFIALR